MPRGSVNLDVAVQNYARPYLPAKFKKHIRRFLPRELTISLPP
jgi:hypothetical protein